MNTDKVGAFIRKLRTDKKLSQYDLAELIPIDRSVVSKWERGEILPAVDKMKILCEIFDITVDELLSGELKTKDNEKERQNNLFKYLLNQDTKYRRLKTYSIILFLVTLIITFSFLIYYFVQTHNTERIYRIYGSSDNYVIDNGLLVITRERSYLKIGSISDKIYDIELYYNDGNINESIYKGSSDLTLTDLYGYNASLNNYNINQIKNNLYIKVNNEEIKLNFTTDYKNDNYLLDTWVDHSENNEYNLYSSSVNSDKIKKEFKCDEYQCLKHIKNYDVRYSIAEAEMSISGDGFFVKYDYGYKKFSYESPNMCFEVIDGKLNCIQGSCNKYNEIYSEYYNDVFKKYLK